MLFYRRHSACTLVQICPLVVLTRGFLLCLRELYIPEVVKIVSKNKKAATLYVV